MMLHEGMKLFIALNFEVFHEILLSTGGSSVSRAIVENKNSNCFKEVDLAGPRN